MSLRIDLDGEITLQNLEQLHARLQTALAAEGEVILSCRNLKYLDTAAFQMLLSFKKSLGKRALLFQDLPPKLWETGALLGLHIHLGLGG